MNNTNLDNSLESIENIIVMSQIIESLKEQQSDFTEDSDEWLEIEKKIVEFECTLFNESVAINLINYETLEEKIPILVILGLHIFKYIDDDRFIEEILLLSDEAILILELILNQLNTIENNFLTKGEKK
jgi:hypothetical protein